jgi:hypothetical protein
LLLNASLREVRTRSGDGVGGGIGNTSAAAAAAAAAVAAAVVPVDGRERPDETAGSSPPFIIF